MRLFDENSVCVEQKVISAIIFVMIPVGLFVKVSAYTCIIGRCIYMSLLILHKYGLKHKRNTKYQFPL